MLQLEHVYKSFGSKQVTRDMNITFERGVYGLLAPNGAGKSTLMKMMTTLLRPDKGSITWDGEDIIGMDEQYRGLLGYLPQDFGYYPNYTPRQFLSYIAALQGLSDKESKERVMHLLSMVGLEDAANKKMKALSGGMVQRVGIAQSLLNDPQLLILDEPTAGLDPKERVRFRNIIHALAADRTVILSTHIVSDIETIASQVVMVKDGSLYQQDSPAGLCAQYQGHIYEVPMDMPMSEGQRVLDEVQEGAQTLQRIYCQEPLSGFEPVQANLEDVFLMVYGG
ncbi:ABC transporter ATP-binding protein [Bombiscardovia apis]|uniref:ABC transporter ATP-binding protein n=1 Tax=Bombiscardovia apis TaxID=2932182 RepID=A0ABM8BDD5_9BIFI|nr:ABC transporter ATP-binding protein [Bombiscardovia apis]BDR54911.1 ABC transporter ATP-binding protein [Bombiscardovia apis]